MRDVSEALRPSRKLTGERLWVSRFWEASACMAGLAGLRPMKGVILGACWLVSTISFKEGVSSRNLISL